MKKLLLLMITILLFAAGCGTAKTNDDQASTGNQGNGEPVNSEPDNNQDDKQQQVDVNEWIQQLEMTSKANAEATGVTFDFALKNNGGEPLTLTFPSGQQYEVVVTNQAGEEVYRYSEGKMFTEALVDKEVKAGETLSFEDTWNYMKNEERVKGGSYEATITILPTQVNKLVIDAKPYEKKVTFDVPEANSAFRNVAVEGENGQYTVTGEARVFEGVFQYNVEDGHKLLVEDTTVKVDEGAPSWSEFKIKLDIPEEDLPVNGTVMMTLYVNSAKDGSRVNQMYIPLESIKK